MTDDINPIANVSVIWTDWNGLTWNVTRNHTEIFFTVIGFIYEKYINLMMYPCQLDDMNSFENLSVIWRKWKELAWKVVQTDTELFPMLSASCRKRLDFLFAKKTYSPSYVENLIFVAYWIFCWYYIWNRYFFINRSAKTLIILTIVMTVHQIIAL